MSTPFKLYRLQQIDSQLDWTRARLKEIEAELAADEALRQAQQQADEAEKNMQAAHRALHQAEAIVSQQRIKIEQTEATLYGGRVQNPKELQDLQNEVAALKRYLVTLEDRQLEAMLTDEEANSLELIARNELARAQANHELRSKELVLEKDRLEKDFERFNDERKAAAAAVPGAELQIYEQLRVKRRGVAVAKVTDRACSACGSTLNAVLLQAAHSPNQLTRCDTCGRILYIG
jgi:predicted  nucleic acid-binding Zn-ribbon protein